MEKEFYAGTWQQQRAFSPAVATRGGRTIWVAGHGATHDASGEPLDGDFEGQARQVFADLAATLERAGSRLADIVTMTVFIIDARYGDRFVEIRKAFFPDAQFPDSALITVAGFANPAMMVEIQWSPSCRNKSPAAPHGRTIPYLSTKTAYGGACPVPFRGDRGGSAGTGAYLRP